MRPGKAQWGVQPANPERGTAGSQSSDGCPEPAFEEERSRGRYPHPGPAAFRTAVWAIEGGYSD